MQFELSDIFVCSVVKTDVSIADLILAPFYQPIGACHDDFDLFISQSEHVMIKPIFLSANRIV